MKSTTGENGASAEIEFCIVVLAVQNLAAAAEVFIQENGKSKNHSSSSNAELIFIIDLPFQKCQQLTQLFSGSLASEFSNLEVGPHHSVWKSSKNVSLELVSHWGYRGHLVEGKWPQWPQRSLRSISKRRFWWDFFVLFIHCAWTSLAHGTAF